MRWMTILTGVMALLISTTHAQQPVTWSVDNLTTVGGHAVTVYGAPAVVETDGVTGVQFDGVDDGLLVNGDILNGATSFTLEMYFYPASDGNFEQRFYHVQEQASDTRRMLFELRSVEGEWYLDTFVRRGAASLALIDENLKHPHDRWTHIAAVYDGAQLRSYVNGKHELSAEFALDALGAARTSLGVRQNLVSWFKGTIAWVKATPRALPPEEFSLPADGNTAVKTAWAESP